MKQLVILMAVGLSATVAAGQSDKEVAPPHPVTFTTGVGTGYGWSLRVTVDANGTSGQVTYSSKSFLSSTSASFSVKNCERMAEAIESAAKAVKNGKAFEADKVGNITITTGPAEVYVPGPGGALTKATKTCVRLGGGETGYFTDPLNLNYEPDAAAKLAADLRAAPAAYSRLKACVDFDAIYKGGKPAFGATEGRGLAAPLKVETRIGDHGWTLSISAGAQVTSRVGPTSARADFPVKDSLRMAEALEEAATAVEKDKRFDNDEVGNIKIATGVMDVYIPGKDGKPGTTVKRKGVLLTGGVKGFLSSDLSLGLEPEAARKFAKDLRAAPGVHARLRSCIDFDSLLKGK